MAKGGEERSGVLLAILGSQRLTLRAMSESASREGITLQQLAVLRIVAREGPVAMSRLSEDLRVTPPNITGVVDRLERKGLVEREGSPTDRRAKLIRLTDKGDRLFAKVQKGYSDELQRALESMTKEEQDILSSLLRKFARSIGKKERTVDDWKEFRDSQALKETDG